MCIITLYKRGKKVINFYAVFVCNSSPFPILIKKPHSFAAHYAGMQKYGIILARQCALSVSFLTQAWAHTWLMMEESIGLLIEEA